jgi:chitinase
MVTKAGVPANKVMVGISSYGRSFKMAKADCRGPDCTFLGTKNNSMALAGECTMTSGYIADAEIRQTQAIMGMGWSEATYVSTYDEASDSDIFIYNNDEWVAWMDVETKKRRIDLYKSLGFAGTSDWAVDLQADMGLPGDGGGIDTDGMLDLTVSCDLSKTYADLDALDRDASGMYPPCVAMHSIRILQGMLTKSFDGYDSAAEGYDKLYVKSESIISPSWMSREL